MKSIFKYFLSILAVGLLGSCTDGFEEINRNPGAPTNTVPDYLFTQLIRSIGFSGNQNLYLYNPQTIPMARLGVADVSDLDKVDNASGVSESWSEYYGKLRNINRLRELLENSTSDVERHRNQLAMVTIYEAHHAFRVTDKFGAIPFGEAGKGDELLFRPAYQSQGTIYKALLDKLVDAVSSLTTDDKTPNDEGYFDFEANAKLFGGGDRASHVESWKKFGNSLILKHALRMSKFDRDASEDYIASALEGPLMSSREDGVGIDPSENDKRNAWGWARYYNPDSRPSRFLATKLTTDTDVSVVEETTVYDPRFFVIYNRNEDGDYRLAPNSPHEIEDLSPGLNITGDDLYPGGENAETIVLWNHDDYKANYCTWNRFYMMSLLGHQQMLTYPEHCLVLAEIYAMGLATGDAEAMYEAGIKASVQDMIDPNYSHFPSKNPGWVVNVTDAELNTLVDHPSVAYNTSDSDAALEQIRTQRWIDYIHRPDNAWALIRRTNLFDLDVNVPIRSGASNNTMIYRLPYPASESNYNGENLSRQIAVMREAGADGDDIRFIPEIFR